MSSRARDGLPWMQRPSRPPRNTAPRYGPRTLLWCGTSLHTTLHHQKGGVQWLQPWWRSCNELHCFVPDANGKVWTNTRYFFEVILFVQVPQKTLFCLYPGYFEDSTMTFIMVLFFIGPHIIKKIKRRGKNQRSPKYSWAILRKSPN